MQNWCIFRGCSRRILAGKASLVGGWNATPTWKIYQWKSIGMIIETQFINGKSRNSWQPVTTNQIMLWSYRTSCFQWHLRLNLSPYVCDGYCLFWGSVEICVSRVADFSMSQRKWISREHVIAIEQFMILSITGSPIWSPIQDMFNHQVDKKLK